MFLLFSLIILFSLDLHLHMTVLGNTIGAYTQVVLVAFGLGSLVESVAVYGNKSWAPPTSCTWA